MKKMLTFKIAMIISGITSFMPVGGYTLIDKSRISKNDLTRQKGLLFIRGVPFTGRLTGTEPETGIKSLQDYRTGKRHGLYQANYPDGQMAARRWFHQGLRKGKHQTWYPDGTLKTLGTYHNDLRTGVHKQWYQNRQIYQEETYMKGELLSHKIWRKNGKIYANYTIRNGRIYGLSGGKLCVKTSGKDSL